MGIFLESNWSRKVTAFDGLLNRMTFFVNLRIGSFIAKLFDREPYVTWGALFKEHMIEYPYLKILGLFKKNDGANYEEMGYSDSLNIISISIADHKIYWPKSIPHGAVLSAYKSVLHNEADNYFRFYSPSKDDIVFDLGVCEGFFSLCLRNKINKVYAFEPFPELCDALSLTLAEDIQIGTAEICNYAVGNSVGSVDFFVDDDLDGSTFEISKVSDKLLKKISVPAITLDKFVSDHKINRVSMIKMDVEGAEYSVLEGAREVIREFRPDLLVSAYHYPYDYERLSRFIVNSGYDIYSGPLVMTNQNSQGRPWYRYALIYATAKKR